MPAAQRPSSTATTSDAAANRASPDVEDRAARPCEGGSYRDATTDEGGGSGGTTRSMTTASSGPGATRCSWPGQRLDPGRARAAFRSRAQVPRGLLLGRPLALHLLEAVAVRDDPVALPPVEQRGDHEDHADDKPPEHLALTAAVHFGAIGRLRDRLVDRKPHRVGGSHLHLPAPPRAGPITRPARSRGGARFASGGSRPPRPRSAAAASWSGAGATSSSFRRARRRSVCFTTRSSSEWNAITTRRPPGASRRHASSTNRSSPSSSSFTRMRSAWNVRVAGWIGL